MCHLTRGETSIIFSNNNSKKNRLKLMKFENNL